MNGHRGLKTVGICLMWVVIAAATQGQDVRRPTGTGPQKGSTQKRVPEPQDRWWSAQRSLEAAIQQLEEYLRLNPNGERAESARQQLQVLRSLTLSASKPEWVRLYLGAGVSSDWRISSVDPQPDKTHVTIEITCPSDFNGDCGFNAFDQSPLVLLDDNGRYYPMLEVGQIPDGVRRVDGYPFVQYRFQPGRVLSVTVEFAPLARGTVSGQVRYRDRNPATPAKFSLIRQKK